MQVTLTLDVGHKRQASALAALLSTLHPGLEFGDRVTVTVGEVSMTGPAAEILGGSNDPNEAFADGHDPAKAFAMPPEAGAPFVPVATVTEAGGSTPVPTSAPATVAATPSPEPAAPPANPGGLDLDAEGLPWDARIHATVEGGGGKKTGEGKWRAKRNVPADLRAQVVAELKAALAAPAPAATPVAPPPPAPAPVAEAPAPVPPAPAPVAEAPPPPPAPVTSATPPAPPAPAPSTAAPAAPSSGGGPAEFARIMRKVTEAQTAGKITAEHTTAAVQACGLQQLRDLLTRADLIPQFEATLDAMMGA